MSDRQWAPPPRASAGPVSLRAAAEGVTVVAGRRAVLGEQLTADIIASGEQALFVRCAATMESDVAAVVVDAAVATFGRLDCAVNNAGGVLASGPLDQITSDAWRAELDLNLTGVFDGLPHGRPHRRRIQA